MSLLMVGVWWDPGEEPSTTVTALPHDPAEVASAAVGGGSGTGTADAPRGSGSGSGALRGGSGTGMAALPDGSAAPGPAAVPGGSARDAATAGLPGGSGRSTATAAVPGGSGSRTPAARSGPARSPAPRTGTPPAPAPRSAVPHTPGPPPGAPAPTRKSSTPRTLTGDRAPRRQHSPPPPLAARCPHCRPPPPPPPAPAPRPLSPGSPAARLPSAPALLRATRVLIPYLRVDAPVMDLGLDREHRLTAPPEDDPKLVGWYKQGASPGEQGTAVAVGHLDTDSGPAVFAGLTELKRDRIIKVRRADGRIAVYTVDKIKSYEKAHFPSQEVYGARGRPELRLITCGGSYDRRKGYSGNVVVFAHLTGVR
ncbi:class F sortase [Streptomyces sp. Go-475]|uniref:class F sortase n=1 Tax=Streptomyces sp. Go-475 TaxID=2072505 RepID=UPI001E630379|nr:class F sortase [Streptomyces sp. Go-475]